MRNRLFWLVVLSLYTLANVAWWVVRAPFRLVRWLFTR